MAEQETVALVCRYVEQAYFELLKVKRAPAVSMVVRLAKDMATNDKVQVTITEDTVVDWWSAHREPMPLLYLGSVHGDAQEMMFKDMTDFPNLLGGIPCDLKDYGS